MTEAARVFWIKRLPLAMLLAASTLLSACGIPRSVGRSLTEGFVEPPTIEIVDLSITRRTADGVGFAAVVEMTNPNKVELPLDEVSFTLRVDGLGRFEAPSAPRISLPPAGSRRTLLRAALPAPTPSDAPIDGRAYRCGVSARYVPPGEIREIGTESGFPLPVARQSIRGTLGRSSPGT